MNLHRSYLTFGCLVLFSLGIIAWILNQQTNYIRTISTITSNASKAGITNIKIILTYHNRYGTIGYHPWFREGLITATTHPNCQLKSQQGCLYTHNRSDYLSSHAIIFCAHSIPRNLLDIPKTRPSTQKWVFFQDESPDRTRQEILTKLNSHFNITATYKFDSNLPMPYGQVCSMSNASFNNNNLKDSKKIELLNIQIRNKTELIAWFVSSCQTPSRREDYVAKLKRYVPVHVYGKCGTMQCNKTDHLTCSAMLNSKYKFYLAFENSLCQGYITEKFFKTNALNIVAIVRGGGNYSMYNPPGTYIDVRDFATVKQLADYIKLLDSRPDLYAEYIIRKKSMICKTLPPRHFLCRLCEHLHMNAHREERVVLSEYWNPLTQCEAMNSSMFTNMDR